MSPLLQTSDHPALLQSYIWQDYDLHPSFPELNRFLEFWRKSIEGALHSVSVAHSRMIAPAEVRAIDGVFRLQYGALTGAWFRARRHAVAPFHH